MVTAGDNSNYSSPVARVLWRAVNADHFADGAGSRPQVGSDDIIHNGGVVGLCHVPRAEPSASDKTHSHRLEIFGTNDIDLRCGLVLRFQYLRIAGSHSPSIILAAERQGIYRSGVLHTRKYAHPIENSAVKLFSLFGSCIAFARNDDRREHMIGPKTGVGSGQLGEPTQELRAKPHQHHHDRDFRCDQQAANQRASAGRGIGRTKIVYGNRPRGRCAERRPHAEYQHGDGSHSKGKTENRRIGASSR